MRYDLPESVVLNGETYRINADFRAALDILEILNDPELSGRERISLALLYFYPEFPRMSPACWQQAVEECFRFLAGDEEPRPGPVLMDWQQDFPYIIAPVNRVVGREVRGEAFFHWWSFLGAYREMGQCLFTQMVAIRSKRAKGQKLDPAEERWYRENRALVDLKPRFSRGEEELMKTWGRKAAEH